jgi:quercetin dioxygenase-like cupin family protein
MQRWDLREIDMPDGTRDPVVLETADGARAVLIHIDAGQQLGEHEVRERAWIVVVDGRVQVSTDGEEFEAEPGTFMTFAPAERRAIRSAEGARILMWLAPWPGAGHYGAEERDLRR